MFRTSYDILIKADQTMAEKILARLLAEFTSERFYTECFCCETHIR